MIKEAKQLLYKRSFHEFVKAYWDVIIPQDMEDSWHIKYLCDRAQQYIEAITNGDEVDPGMVINISPGSSKSTIFSIMLPVWAWTVDPTLKILTGSHTTGLALDMSVKSRDILRSPSFIDLFGDIELKSDSDTKSQYSNTLGGVRVATSAGSSVIGKHFNIIIIDDPVKTNATQTEMDSAGKWLTQELATRKIDKQRCPTILIMQRLSHNDPAAQLQKNKDVKLVKLPAEITERNKGSVHPKELIERYTEIDGVKYMDPKRLGPKVLKDMKITLGSRGYASQFLQSPDPLEGGIIKEEWIDVVPLTEQLYAQLKDKPPHFFIDTAYTADEGNDPSAITTAKYAGNTLYILDSTQWWAEFPTLVKNITAKIMERGYTPQSLVKVEGKASGLSVIQQLRNTTQFNVTVDDTLKKLKGTKNDRLESISPTIEARKVKFIEGGWNEELLDQLTSLTPAHFDMRDTLIMAVNSLILNNNSGTYAVRRAR